MTRMKRWMIEILQRFGFWAVLGFSAYPNAAFDLVGGTAPGSFFACPNTVGWLSCVSAPDDGSDRSLDAAALGAVGFRWASAAATS